MKRRLSLAVAVGGLVVLCGSIFWLFTRRETSTMAVCTGGQVCTEYFYLKDGVAFRSVCPSEGGEEYPLPQRCTRSGNDCRCP
jgi:hypothetical protein